MNQSSSNQGVDRGVDRSQALIAALAIAAIVLHVALSRLWPERVWTEDPSLERWLGSGTRIGSLPLLVALIGGGLPLVWELLKKIQHLQFGSDILAGISIVTSLCLDEYLAGTLVVLMLSGGEALESYAVRSASSVLDALARRMPSVAHRSSHGKLEDIQLDQVSVGDLIQVMPHETCPVDGVVVEGHGIMDESYLTGEPYMMSKTPGSTVFSGAVNGDRVLTVRAEKLAVDSRYAKIMDVMRASEQQRPEMRRLGDQLGAIYTPIAVSLAVAAWLFSGEAVRFLAVLVVATPCPLLIAIPVTIIGSISLAARRAIIIRDPALLEVIDQCRTVIFDKTGTLTYGKPQLVHRWAPAEFDDDNVLSLVASMEQYSKHPLAGAIVSAARDKGMSLSQAEEITERPGEGMSGLVSKKELRITSRKQWLAAHPSDSSKLPTEQGGLECLVTIDGQLAAVYSFRDTPRKDVVSFVDHLSPRHRIDRVVLLSGDRVSEVQHLADQVGIKEVYAGQSPEEKLEFVRAATSRQKTLFVGDGINDAPALTAATVGVAFGQNSDVTIEAAGAVVMDSSLQKVDELLHISRRMRRIALQSAVGGMALSTLGMLIAAAGYLPPVAGALTQEVIDVVAVVNALRCAWPPGELTDF